MHNKEIRNRTNEPPAVIDNIIGEIRQKLQGFKMVEISHVRRQDNHPTHILAQYVEEFDVYVT